ncbi:DMT family transporter [Legionella feeleii]|uniref:Drug/transporter permease n=1 Tax=Legionella feeleii TaxID=453 RepID=A0A0W0U1X4_9GAMM|nr:DMT family transporter [Legionella feeleii]KTD01904.1 drug/transporter permease [Legionella feeleii]SPX59425.1 drug/transporter permease [Legionella feeleii]
MAVTARTKGIIYIAISYIIFSADEAVIAKLIQLGQNHTIHGHNPISFCNLLFAGSLIGAITLFILQYKNFKAFNFRKLTTIEWLWILVSALLMGFFTPTFFFFGIMYTNVINVILLSTLQPPLTLFAGWLCFREKPTIRLVIASAITMSGCAAIVLLQQWLSIKKPVYLSSTPHLGEIYVILGVVSSSLSTLISFHAIKVLPGGIFNTLRMGLGAVFFFFIAVMMFGWSHFADLFSPFLWKWMLLYGNVIVALGMLFNDLGMQRIKVVDDVIAGSFVPVSSIFFSYLILGIVPGIAQLIGGIIILTGIILAVREQIVTL